MLKINPTDAKPLKSIRALARGMQVLKLLQQSGGMSLNDLFRATGLPKATLLRILQTLEEEGMVWQRIIDNAYLASHMMQSNPAMSEEEHRMVELASPLLEKLTQEVQWPSILGVPRLTHMEVVEATAPRSYFSHIEVGPVGFEVNLLYSSIGRAYLAFCPEAERETILDRLRHSTRPGDQMAKDSKWVDQLLESTRLRGCAIRDPRFGGDYDRTIKDADDKRNSMAAPVMVGERVVGCINLTWLRKIISRDEAVKRYSTKLLEVASTLSQQLSVRS